MADKQRISSGRVIQAVHPAWIFFDFDGVLTDNRVWVFDDGREAVVCTRADGLGFGLLRERGVRCAIISTEKNPVVGHRARKLGLPVLQGVQDKGKVVQQFCQRRKINPRHTAFVGNDLNDLPALRVVGYRLCPRDAAPEIRELCDHVLRTRGGEGVVREIASRFARLFGQKAGGKPVA